MQIEEAGAGSQGKAGVKLGTDPVIQIREIEKFEKFSKPKISRIQTPSPAHPNSLRS